MAMTHSGTRGKTVVASNETMELLMLQMNVKVRFKLIELLRIEHFATRIIIKKNQE